MGHWNAGFNRARVAPGTDITIDRVIWRDPQRRAMNGGWIEAGCLIQINGTKIRRRVYEDWNSSVRPVPLMIVIMGDVIELPEALIEAHGLRSPRPAGAGVKAKMPSEMRSLLDSWRKERET